jgi:hypothetical protein
MLWVTARRWAWAAVKEKGLGEDGLVCVTH